MRGPRRIGLIANLNKATALPVARGLLDRFMAAGRHVTLKPDLARALGHSPKDADPWLDVDLLVCLGGDGTLLNAVGSLGGADTPVLGVNLGGLGFLTAVSSSDVEPCAEAILEGHYTIEDRFLLKASFRTPGADGGASGEEITLHALNELMLDEGSFERRAIVLKVHVDGAYVGTFTADGLIVSTPTGSTAYSLSAGGPILNPTLPALVLTPVCPHSLSIRPLVIQEREKVVVESLLPDVSFKIIADGQQAHAVANGSPVWIGLSERTARLAFLRGRSYYEILRSKLNWGGIPKDR